MPQAVDLFNKLFAIKKGIMLFTNLTHIEDSNGLQQTIQNHPKVMVICGRMNPDSIEAYRVVEELKEVYPEVKFFDLEIDNPLFSLKELIPKYKNQLNTPIVLYFNNAELTGVRYGTTTKRQLINFLNTDNTNKHLD